MGPRPCGRGNGDKSMLESTLSNKLQWGRGLAAAEMWRTRPGGRPNSRGFNGAAAFRPRKFHRIDGHCRLREASMGPRPCGRGNSLTKILPRVYLVRLQWGRGLAAAEIRYVAAVQAEIGMLQWGRGLAAAEICSLPAIVVVAGPCFNGAAAFRPRKSPGADLAIAKVLQLQWGRGLSAAEIA